MKTKNGFTLIEAFIILTIILLGAVLIAQVLMPRNVSVEAPKTNPVRFTTTEMYNLRQYVLDRNSNAAVCVSDIKGIKLTTQPSISETLANKKAALCIAYAKNTKDIASDPDSVWYSVPYLEGQKKDPGFTPNMKGGVQIFKKNVLVGAIGVHGLSDDENQKLAEEAVSSFQIPI